VRRTAGHDFKLRAVAVTHRWSRLGSRIVSMQLFVQDEGNENGLAAEGEKTPLI